jgi:threonine/homoserine efflux transporter RhtA
MTTSTREQHLPTATGGTATAGQPGQLTGIALMTGSAASNQLGAAIAALAFPVLGPAGAVAVRQWVAGAVLLTVVRPKFTSFTRQQWRLVLALALIFATMNLSLYTAIDRIGLGLAVTLEFLGPLSVALLASRRVIDLGCALIAAAVVVVLARPQPSTDYAGILCSAVPMIADTQALRRVPARFFGVFMSVNPVFAALTGLIVLGQSLEAADWLTIAVIVTVNAVSVNSGSQAHGPGRRSAYPSKGPGRRRRLDRAVGSLACGRRDSVEPADQLGDDLGPVDLVQDLVPRLGIGADGHLGQARGPQPLA